MKTRPLVGSTTLNARMQTTKPLLLTLVAVLVASLATQLLAATTTASCNAVGPCDDGNGNKVELTTNCHVKFVKADGTSGSTGPVSGTQSAGFAGVNVQPAAGKTWATVTACADIVTVP